MRKYLFVVAAIVLATVMFSCKNEEKKTDPQNPDQPGTSDADYPEVGARNCILLEEFTGQDCPNCPRAIKAIRAELDAMMNGKRVAWVAHHYGYGEDMFTQKGDKTICTLIFSTYAGESGTYAPAAAIERTSYTASDGETGYVHVADYAADSTLLNSFLAAPAEASIVMKGTLVDSTLTVTLTGKSNQAEAYVTIMLCQNGLVARQSGGGSNYTHNEVVRAYLTAAKGDQLTVDGEKKYTYTATYRIPATISNCDGENPFATDYDNMYVVASVHGACTKAAKGPIYNTDMLYLSNLK